MSYGGLSFGRLSPTSYSRTWSSRRPSDLRFGHTKKLPENVLVVFPQQRTGPFVSGIRIRQSKAVALVETLTHQWMLERNEMTAMDQFRVDELVVEVSYRNCFDPNALEQIGYLCRLTF